MKIKSGLLLKRCFTSWEGGGGMMAPKMFLSTSTVSDALD